MMSKEQKKNYVEEMKKVFSSNEAVMIAHYKGLNVKELDKIRAEMRKNGIFFKVTKNKITKIAIKETKCKELEKFFTGPTAAAISSDPITSAKILAKYAKGDSNLKIVQIYRLRGELEKSANRIQELIIDEDFNSIKSDLDLELTKIEFERGKVDFAIQNYDRIGKDYPNTQTAIESYYLLSEIYLRAPNVDFEKVQFFMNESMRQNTNSPIKQIIDKRRSEVDKLIKIDAELKQLKDSERLESLFLAGQILAFNLSKYEESKMYFEEIVTKHQSSDYFPQSLFALYAINLKTGSEEYLTYRDKIISDFPKSDFAKYIINSEGIDKVHLPSKTLSQAEQLKDKDLNESLMLYRQVIKIDKSSDSSKIAAYFLGMHFDYEVSLIDSAKYYYEFISQNFPSSPQAENAIKRLEVLNAQ